MRDSARPSSCLPLLALARRRPPRRQALTRTRSSRSRWSEIVVRRARPRPHERERPLLLDLYRPKRDKGEEAAARRRSGSTAAASLRRQQRFETLAWPRSSRARATSRLDRLPVARQRVLGVDRARARRPECYQAALGAGASTPGGGRSATGDPTRRQLKVDPQADRASGGDVGAGRGDPRRAASRCSRRSRRRERGNPGPSSAIRGFAAISRRRLPGGLLRRRAQARRCRARKSSVVEPDRPVARCARRALLGRELPARLVGEFPRGRPSASIGPSSVPYERSASSILRRDDEVARHDSASLKRASGLANDRIDRAGSRRC